MVVTPTDQQRQAAERIAGLGTGALLDHLPHTDAGNARRLINAHRRDIRFAPGLGWHAWDGRRWCTDDTGELVRRQLQVTQLMREQAAQAGSDGTQLFGHANRSESRARIDAAISIAAQMDTSIIVRADDLDARPYLLNATGTVNLRTGDLRAHAPEELLTRIAGAGYTPEARAATWTAFLERILPDAEVRGYVQRLLGVAAIGELLEHDPIGMHECRH